MAAVAQASAWAQPTPRPPLATTSQLTNLSNLPGADLHPAVALHRDGWAAVVWVNTPPDSDTSRVFVRVQDPSTHAWQPGVTVTTRGAASFAGHPDLAIDEDGRIHVVFAQDTLRPHYTRSDDYGATWTAPVPLPVPSGFDGGGAFSRSAVDDRGQLHVLVASGTGDDAFSYLHFSRAADALPGTAWRVEPQVLGGSKELRAAIAFVPRPGGTLRTVVATGCLRGCVPSQPRIAFQDRPGGPWQRRSVPGAAAVGAGHDVNWISLVAAERPASGDRLCLAWGYYAHSGNYSSCSADGGASWQPPAPIITTPASADFTAEDTGATPELLYEPTSDRIVAVSLYRQAGAIPTVYPVYSHRRVTDGTWTPRLTGPFRDHQPPLRLFPATRRSHALANDGLRVAYRQHALALAVWAEAEADENIDVYAGSFAPGPLLAREGLPLAPTAAAPQPTRPPATAVPVGYRPRPTATPWLAARPVLPPDFGFPLFPPPPGSAVRLAWFPKRPRDGNLDVVYAAFTDITLTHPDVAERDTLIARGLKGVFLQYVMLNEIHVPPSCTTQPWSNQVAFKTGDACWIEQEHPDWYLRDTRGNRICGRNVTERFCMMDPGSDGWRAFWVQRVAELQSTHGWTCGVLLDNTDASRARAIAPGRTPAGYRDDAAYQAAVAGMLAFLRERYFAPQRRPLYANITAMTDERVWTRYLAHLDGALDEAWSVGWRGSYRGVRQWEAHLQRAELTQALGKHGIFVGQGRRDDLRRQQFAFGSYLLIVNGRASFRYAGPPGGYSEAWLYANYALDLGAPLGPRVRDGAVWRRAFERGTVAVDPVRHTATIAVQTP